MSEQLLKQILNELTDVKSEIKDVKNHLTNVKNDLTNVKNDLTNVKNDLTNVKTQLDENTQITKAILHRQDEIDAKLDRLSMDLHEFQGEVKSEMEDLKDHLKFNTQKITENELEIFKLKK